MVDFPEIVAISIGSGFEPNRPGGGFKTCPYGIQSINDTVVSKRVNVCPESR